MSPARDLVTAANRRTEGPDDLLPCFAETPAHFIERAIETLVGELQANLYWTDETKTRHCSDPFTESSAVMAVGDLVRALAILAPDEWAGAKNPALSLYPEADAIGSREFPKHQFETSRERRTHATKERGPR